MENNEMMFEEMLPLYLDVEEMEVKKEMDWKSSASASQKEKIQSPFNTKDSISIQEFVNDYLQISGSCETLYHSGLKSLDCKYVIGVDNNYANKNPGLVYNGYLLLVIDSRGKRGTYLNPRDLKFFQDNQNIEEKAKQQEKTRLNDLREVKSFWTGYMTLCTIMEQCNEISTLIRDCKKTNKVKALISAYKKE
ncbi:MAG: hypothetical protein PHN72_06215 [Bacilli bacterium]|nr:hypothetical protein [Bacilli bacterium]